MTSNILTVANNIDALNISAKVHDIRGNDLLASWMRASVSRLKEVWNNLIEVEQFLDNRDDELMVAHRREDGSREFDRDRYGYDRLDDYHDFQSQWYTMLDENEDNLEW